MRKRDIRRDRDIWLGDVLDTWRRLGLTSRDDRAAAAELLGFDAEALRSRLEAPAAVTPDADRTTGGDTAASATPRADAEDTGASHVIPSKISDESWFATIDEPAWIAKATPLASEQSAHVLWKPPHVPLLRQHWTRHILAAVSAVRVEEGALDERRVVESMTRVRPMLQVPRRFKRTLRRGLQVLVDRGEAMMPFGQDAQQIIGQLRIVVGKGQLIAASFERTPMARDIFWLRERRRKPWAPPSPGTPVLVISDLGISQRFGDVPGGTVAEWLAFAAQCRAAGCRTVAIVPRGERACPAVLRQAFTVIPWDQRTNVSTALRLLRAAAHT